MCARHAPYLTPETVLLFHPLDPGFETQHRLPDSFEVLNLVSSYVPNPSDKDRSPSSRRQATQPSPQETASSDCVVSSLPTVSVRRPLSFSIGMGFRCCCCCASGVRSAWSVVAVATLAAVAVRSEIVKMCLPHKASGHVRSDPIVTKDCVSDHVNTFYGPQIFHPSTTNEDLRASSDPEHSTSVYLEDQSLYWHPAIYKVGRRNDPEADATNETMASYYYYERATVSFASPYYRWDTAVDTEVFPPNFRVSTSVFRSLARPDDGPDFGSECLCPQNCRRKDDRCEPLEDSELFAATACGEFGLWLYFPNCWDGGADEGDASAHMAYDVDGDCPEGFPRRLPQIQLFVRIEGYEGGAYTFSDHTLPGEEEFFHASFMNGWDQDVLQDILENCRPAEDSSCDCHEFLTRKPSLLETSDDEADHHWDHYWLPNDAEAAKVCPLDVRRHIVDEDTQNVEGELPRGSCSVPLIQGVDPEFVDECGLEYTPSTFDETRCSSPVTHSRDDWIGYDWITCDESKCASYLLLNDEVFLCYGNEDLDVPMECSDGWVPEIIWDHPPIVIDHRTDYSYFTCCPPGPLDDDADITRHCSDPLEEEGGVIDIEEICDTFHRRKYPRPTGFYSENDKELFLCCDNDYEAFEDFMGDSECVPYCDLWFHPCRFDVTNEIGGIGINDGDDCLLSEYPFPHVLGDKPYDQYNPLEWWEEIHPGHYGGPFQCCKTEGPPLTYVVDLWFKVTVYTELTLYSFAALTSAILAVALTIPLLTERKNARHRSASARRRSGVASSYSTFNLYLVFLALPDLVVALVKITINANMMMRKESTFDDDGRHYQIIFLTPYVAANLYLNAVVAHQVLRLLKLSHSGQRFTQPKVAIITLQAVKVYVVSLLFLLTGLLAALTEKTPLGFFESWVIQLYWIPAVVPPILYVVYVTALVLRSGILPSAIQATTEREKGLRVLTIYFFRIFYVFIGVWIPGIVLFTFGLVQNNVAYGDHPWLIWLYSCTAAIQPIVSFSVVLAKPDVRMYVWKLVTLSYLINGCTERSTIDGRVSWRDQSSRSRRDSHRATQSLEFSRSTRGSAVASSIFFPTGTPQAIASSGGMPTHEERPPEVVLLSSGATVSTSSDKVSTSSVRTKENSLEDSEKDSDQRETNNSVGLPKESLHELGRDFGFEPPSEEILFGQEHTNEERNNEEIGLDNENIESEAEDEVSGQERNYGEVGLDSKNIESEAEGEGSERTPPSEDNNEEIGLDSENIESEAEGGRSENMSTPPS